jgi:hypothetical protein
MPQITIPKNQHLKEGELMEVIISSRVGDVSVWLKSKTVTSSASYDESWNTRDFSRGVHGFHGINDDLQLLVHLLEDR